MERSERLNGGAAAPSGYEVSSVRKALELLACFTPRANCWSLSELARAAGIPKSTAHNLMRTLQTFDLVRQDELTRVYSLGPRALELGLVFTRSTDVLARSRAVISRLSELTGETAKMGILSGDQVLIIAAVESRHQLHTRGDVGTRWPLHSSSLGKAALSVLPDAEGAEILMRQGMTRFTPATLTTWPELERELKRIRSRGYAVDMEENEPAVRCIAAPVTDALRRTVAAISISGPTARLKRELMEDYAAQVTASARALARQLNR